MILITGGTGIMGSSLVRKLAAQHCKIRVFTLPNDPHVARISKYTDDIVYGDIANPDDVLNVCQDIHTVYHLAAIIITDNPSRYEKINVGGTQNLITAAIKHKVKHFIHISSASVTYPKVTPYSLSKKNGEHLVAYSGLPYTIVRPTLVYDKYCGGQEFDMFMAYLQRFPFVPFIGKGQALKRPVYSEDVITGLVSLYKNKKALSQIYNFSGGEVISMIELARLGLKLLGKPNKPIISIPVPICKILAVLMKLILKHPPLKWQVIAGVTQDANLDPFAALRDLGYFPAKISEKLPDCFPRT